MQPRRGPPLAYGERSMSKILRPDDRRVKKLLLNLTGVAGLLFLALALLHLTHGLVTTHAFHAYVALFLALEGVFFTVRLWTFFRKRASPSTRPDDEETGMIAASKDRPAQYWSGIRSQCDPPLLYWVSRSTEDARSKKAADGKRNSL